MMAGLLSRKTQLSVQEIINDEKPVPDVIYIVPSNSNLVFLEGRFHLTTPSPEIAPKPSINLLFQSMAEEFDERAIGVILSGTGSDGTRGLRAIKAAGGITFVQSPDTAKYEGMPRSAIDAGVADHVAAPEQIGHELERLLHFSGTIPDFNKLEQRPEELFDLFEKVRQRTKIDFSDYKSSTIQRRLRRRMVATETGTIETYLTFANTHPEELDAFAKETLISVTEFFRDEKAFRALEPFSREILARKQPGDELRIWVVGCATGEEAYSLAIMFSELIKENATPVRLQVFATDIDNDGLMAARRGIYSHAAMADMPHAYVARYFQPSSNGFEPVKALRDCVTFARHDIVSDPSFLRLDLVSCRNVLIYFNAELQGKVLATLRYSLREEGLLFLGRSETVAQQEALYSVADSQARIFRPQGQVHPVSISKLVRGQLKRRLEDRVRSAATGHEKDFLNALADQFGPAMLVDASFRILHTHGEVARFISFPSGTPEMNLAQLIVPEFSSEVMTTLYRAKKRQASAYSRKRRIASLNRSVWRLGIHPAGNKSDGELFLVVFENADQLTGATEVAKLPGRQSADDVDDNNLESELTSTREHLQTLVEEMAASKEEMEALNEELQAANEELQATNEELVSVNADSQIKSAELAAINSDFESVYNTVDFPVLLFDTGLFLERANGAAIRAYNLSLLFVGQHIARLKLPGYLKHIDNRLGDVLTSGRKEVFPAEFNGRAYQVFVTPVLALSGIVRGIVIVVIDNTDLVLAQERIRDSQERLMSIMNHSLTLVSVKDAAGRYEFINHRFEELFLVKSSDVIGQTDEQIFGHGIGKLLRDGDLDALMKHGAVETTEAIPLARGTLWLESNRFPIFDTAGALRSVCMQAIDITRRRQADEQLRLAAKVFNGAGEAIMITDAKAKIITVNDSFTKITGFTVEEALGRTPGMLKSGQQSQEFYRAMWSNLVEQGSWQGEIVNRRKNGEVYPEWLTINSVKNHDGQLANYVGIFSDITAMKSSQQRIEFLASHDELTGIPNRNLLTDRLKHALFQAKRQDHHLAVLFIDLDNFKNINDSLGHDVGDLLLVQATERLQQCLRDADTLARLGGDEFVALLSDIELDEVNTVAGRIVDFLAASFRINGSNLYVSASIGISIFPEDGEDSISLLKNADTAMYRAKERGRNQYQFFADEMKVIALQRMTLESGLRAALDAEHLRMVYQPKVDIRTGAIVGAEALLRWNDPILGEVSPAKFIPVAEGCGLISAVGARVFKLVLTQIATWRIEGLTLPYIAINVSAHQLRDVKFVDKVTSWLRSAGVPAECIGIEITESALMERIDVVREMLVTLEEMGVRLSIDDFGTGYSSLAYLRKLPIHELKVDRSFVDGIANEPDDRSIAKTIIDMGHALGLRVVAEGVEDEAQLNVLKAEGCDVAQGYLFHRPLSVEDFRRLLAAPGKIVPAYAKTGLQ
jgi:two-component system CheB/CheR fusion protein